MACWPRNGRPSDVASRYPDHDPVTITELLMGDYADDTDHPWHRLERGEITLAENRELNRAALAASGHRDAATAGVGVDGGGLTFELNAPMIELVGDLRAAEPRIKLGVLTNNVREFRPMWWEMLPFEEWFDAVVDSHEVGLRKPNPAIYELALTRLDVTAGERRRSSTTSPPTWCRRARWAPRRARRRGPVGGDRRPSAPWPRSTDHGAMPARWWRNMIDSRGPSTWATFGTQCCQSCWQAPPITSRSPWPTSHACDRATADRADLERPRLHRR